MAEKKRQIRTLDLDSEFVDGYAKGWYMAVPEAFKDELDIKYTERVEKKKKVLRWTQGVPPLYTFKEGHIFYYDRAGYYGWPWPHIQVDRAMPDRFDESGGRGPGYVFVKFFEVNEEKTGVKQTDTAQMTQGNLVHFLRTGEIRRMKPVHPDFK